MMKVLISVRSEVEAVLAANNGADFIDLKEPREGALGGLAARDIASIVRCLREVHPIKLPVSATIGDIPMTEIGRIAAAVHAVGACGVDYVKVGIDPTPDAIPVLNMLARCGHAVVPVFIADQGLDFELLRRVCAMNFPALMADTADKRCGSLFDCCASADLQGFVRTAREAGKLVGLAGALRMRHLRQLQELAPDFAGFRSAVCEGDRSGTLDAARVRTLALALSDRLAA